MWIQRGVEQLIFDLLGNREKEKVMRRKEVLFAVIGGIVGAVLVMAAGSFSPLGAQNEVSRSTLDI